MNRDSFLTFEFLLQKEQNQRREKNIQDTNGQVRPAIRSIGYMGFLCDLNETKQKCNMWNLSINLGIDMTTDDRGTKMHVKLIFSLLKVSNRILFKFLESYFSSAHLQMLNYGYGPILQKYSSLFLKIKIITNIESVVTSTSRSHVSRG